MRGVLQWQSLLTCVTKRSLNSMMRIKGKLIYHLLSLLIVFSFGFMSAIVFNWDPNERPQEVGNSASKDTSVSPETTFLVVVVFSGGLNGHRRQAIRQSWLRLSSERKVKHYFIIGSLDVNQSLLDSLLEEQRLHNDLLLFPHLKDTYTTLALKLLQTFKWFSSQTRFKYLVKVDDDSFLRVDQLFDELLDRSVAKKDSKPLYMGFFDGRAHVKRTGQWSESNWFLCDRYLPYALGGGYVVSEDLVRFVAQNSNLLQLFRSEDVSLGVWLSALNINRIHDMRFDTEYQSRGCLNSHLIIHKQSVDKLKILYENLQTFGKLCQIESEVKLSYEYNWKLPPTLCCHRNISLKMHANH